MPREPLPATSSNATRSNLSNEQWRAVFARIERGRDAGSISDETDPTVADVLAYYETTRFAAAPETSAFAQVGDAAFASLRAPQAGLQCGAYTLIESIGRGGMGSVWRAKRGDGAFDAEVAVKLLGSLALSAQARARFAREAQLLARLAHPNIARMLDAGVTDDGQRYLVLDWVRGTDIRSYCEGKSQQEILALFRQLLGALAFAHAQLILHRDIKPGNVLVDTNGQVKLLDFGVAKWLVEDEDTDNLEELTRLSGAAYTEAYAAPEQVLDLPVGVAADVFSLGSVLCELLTGERVDWSIPKRQWASAASDARLLTPLNQLPRDLRLIIAKAISPAAQARYPSVIEFDEDVRRFLQNEPVRAGATSRRYVFAKFVARHRIAVALTALGSAAIVGSLVFAIHQLGEAREQQRIAMTEATKANEISKFTTGLFSVLDPRVSATIDRSKLSAKQILDLGRERIRTELQDQPETRLAMLGTLAEMYGRLGQEEDFLALNDERRRLATELYGEHHPIVYDAIHTDLWADVYSGNYDDARATLTKLDAGANARGEIGAKGDERAAIRLHAWAETMKASAQESGEPLLLRYRRAIAAFESARAVSPDYAATIANYGGALQLANNPTEALKQYDRALATIAQIRADKSHAINEGDVFGMLRGRAKSLQLLQRNSEAEQDLRNAIDLAIKSAGGDHVLTKQARGDLAFLLHQSGRRDAAWQEMSLIDATPTPQSGNTAGLNQVRVLRARMLMAEGRHKEAAELVTLSIQSWRSSNDSPLRLREAEILLTEIDQVRTSTVDQSPRR